MPEFIWLFVCQGDWFFVEQKNNLPILHEGFEKSTKTNRIGIHQALHPCLPCTRRRRTVRGRIVDTAKFLMPCTDHFFYNPVYLTNSEGFCQAETPEVFSNGI